MKPLRYTLIALAATCGFAYAQTTAYTTPVGYVTSYIGPNASANTAGAATFIAPSLVMPTDYAAAAAAAPVEKTITLPAGVPVGLDSGSMLEIADGANEGWWSAITASTDTTITVADNFPAGIAAGTKITVRKFTTIQDLFGDNAPGLTGDSNLQTIPNPEIVPQQAKVIRWADGYGWYDEVTEELAGTDIIYPGTAVKVINMANTTLPVVMVGEVKLTKTQVDIFPAFNWLGQPNPTGGTLGSMLFGTQILGTDKLDIFLTDVGSSQGVDRFIAFDGVMYNEVTEEDASAVEIVAGGGYQILRPEGGASVITIPAQVVAP